jgi:hypothetical protein
MHDNDNDGFFKFTPQTLYPFLAMILFIDGLVLTISFLM